MAIHVVSLTREINLDHEETCESCGHKFMVVSRVYSESTASFGSSLITNPGARARQRVDNESSMDLIRKTKNIKDYHHCPKCGLYDQKDIQKFRELHPLYLKKVKKGKLTRLIAAIPLGLFPILLWVIGSMKKNIPNASSIGFIYLMIVTFICLFFSVGFIYESLKTRPKQESEYIQNLNTSETCARWLKNWNKKSNQELFTNFNSSELDVNGRRSYWGMMSSIQHYLDPL